MRLLSILFLCIGLTAFNFSWAANCDSDGFVLPIKDHNASDGKVWSVPYNYFGRYYSGKGGYHPGEDWNYGVGEDDYHLPVYSTSVGTLVRIGSAGSGLGLLIVVKHTGSFTVPAKTGYYGSYTTNTVYSAYVHVENSPFSSKDIGTCVDKNTVLGYIMNPEGGSHLHFEMGNSSKNPGSSWYPNDLGNGYYASTSKIVSDGFIAKNIYRGKFSINLFGT